MLTIPGYELTGKLYQSNSSIIYQGQRQRDQLPIVLKILDVEDPTPLEPFPADLDGVPHGFYLVVGCVDSAVDQLRKYCPEVIGSAFDVTDHGALGSAVVGTEEPALHGVVTISS